MSTESSKPEAAGRPVRKGPVALVTRWFRVPARRDLALFIAMALAMCLVALSLLLGASAVQAQPLNPGDRLQLTVEGGAEFSGRFQLDSQGRLQLPYAGPLRLSGLRVEEASQAVSDRLVRASLFKAGFARVTVQVLAWAPVPVHVSGEVFNPGAVKVNTPSAREHAVEPGAELPGAAPADRRLSSALRAAGGVTPWADLGHVAVRRAGKTELHDLRFLFDGGFGEDPDLQAFDEILVPTRETPDTALLRPSSVTPPGIKIMVSNILQPTSGNAGAAIGNGAISLSYGSRLVQAAVAANCVGGASLTNASRHVVLLRTNRRDGTTQNWQVGVERLVAGTDPHENPFLQEGDAVACYDASMTGIRDVFRALTELVTPFSLLRRMP
jgi:polysaccharide export outer membrane protein